MTKIAVIGTGYVGLVSGLCLAKIGHNVICVDNNSGKIESLKNGIIPIFEPNLKEILNEAISKKTISFTNNLSQAIEKSDAVFIAVGTPQNQDGSADLSFIFEVAKQIAVNIDSHKTIITKSTVPVGTNFKIKELIKKINPKAEFCVVSNPEFLREGFAIEDFLKPERIIIGCEDEKGQKIMSEIYDYFQNITKIIFTDIKTAEIIKYASNSFLAMKICFINEMADLCEKVDANVKKLSEAIGLDSRIGDKFLNPGPGFGGSCFPKDILALENFAKQNNVDLSLVKSTIISNQKRPAKMVKKIIDAYGQNIDGKIIAFLGLAFKGNTDDIRHSPAIEIIKQLIKKGAKINGYDPKAIKNCQKELAEFPQISYFNNPYQAIENADFTVIATEWEEFRKIDLEKLKALQKSDLLIDLRNVLDVKKVREVGFRYINVGVN